MEQPDWMEWVQWAQPVAAPKLVADMSLIPTHPGFYAFTEDPAPLRKHHVLYIGETGMAGGLRARLRSYLRADPTTTKVRHMGALFILHRRHQNIEARLVDPAHTGTIYVRWAPLMIARRARMDIETAMMQYYECHYNQRQMKSATPYDT
ncbi:hypothetical protein [Sagittula salina]|uniref:Uncharacterized protein n=1 Tax=Sagittula salina TaxID=2820268 RepID=A0A940MVU9_9RHOB|nr:hypothetical protein [Sagittula salina]MBP0483824.1 hypothetical protein [Sagittula salina]